MLSFEASLVAQWLRICLPMQRTQVQALVREDPTCRGATKPVHHNYWACALEPVSHNYWAHVPQLLKPTRLEPVLSNKRSHRDEKPTHCNEDPMQPKKKKRKKNEVKKKKKQLVEERMSKLSIYRLKENLHEPFHCIRLYICFLTTWVYYIQNWN